MRGGQNGNQRKSYKEYRVFRSYFSKTRLIKLDVFSIFFHLATSSISQQDSLLQNCLEMS